MSDPVTSEMLSTITKLNDSNYSVWKHDMRAALQVKKLWHLTSGQEAKPSAPAEAVQLWEEKAEQAAGLIYQRLEHSMQVMVQDYMDDPVKMWTELQKINEQDNPAAHFNAYDEFFNITKKEDESLTNLVSSVELALHKIRSTRSSTLKLEEFENELACACLIRALPEDYASFRSAVLLMKEFKWNNLKEAFAQEQQNRQERIQLQPQAMFTSTSSAVKPISSQGVTCTFCGIPKHTEENCYMKQAASKDAHVRAKKNREEKRRKGRKGQKAHVAQQDESAESAEFAGNASALDYTNPHSPLIPDAGTDWIADTGATCHMTPHRHWFTKYSTNHTPIRLANNQVIYSVGIGTVRFQPVVGGKPGQLLEFERVLHVPDLRNNLLSVLYLTRSKSYVVTIHHNKMLFHRHGTVLFTANITSYNAATLNSHIVPTIAYAAFTSTCPLNTTLWHRHFAHLNHGDVNRLMTKELVKGMVIKSKSTPDPICEPYIAGKQHRSNVSKLASHRASGLLQLVHSDIHGPLPVQSRHGFKYWITFIDDYSRYWAVLPLKKKSDAFAAFKQFKAYAENQLGVKIKATRDDKGGEYVSKEWDQFCITAGIHRQHTIRDKPHQNGVAERANRTLAEGITTMLNEAHLPSSFWWDAVAAFVHVHNHSPTSAVSASTPYELWFQSKPDVSHLRVFGCTSYVLVKKDQHKQLQSHTQKCVFLGYPSNYKGWLFWNPLTRKEVISDSAQFDERVFPGTSRNPVDLRVNMPTQTEDLPEQGGVEDAIDVLPAPPPPPAPMHPADPPMPTPTPTPSPPPNPSPSPPSHSPPHHPPSPATHPPKREHTTSPLLSEQASKKQRPASPWWPDPMWRPIRRHTTGWWDVDYVGQRLPRRVPGSPTPPQRFNFNSAEPTVSDTAPDTASDTDSAAQPDVVEQPEQDIEMDSDSPDELDIMSEEELQAEALMFAGLIDFGANAGLEDIYLSYEDALEYAFQSSNCAEHVFSAQDVQHISSEPYQWKDIKGRPDADLWEKAAMEEFISLIENGTFEPVRLPPGRKPIGCRWVFKLKRKADGSVDRYKARLVAKGFSQQPGLEFSQVFAPTAKWAALRAILAIAAFEDLELYSVDISTAFLNGEMEHDVYMNQPEGFEDYFGPGFVLKLIKSIYGLKQAGHQWHKKLDSVMKSMGFKLSMLMT
ncbi:hypothetical protein ACEPAF_5777 [Sanghuangporus sanghuang]